MAVRGFERVGDRNIEAAPVQGILPVNMEDQGDIRLYRFTLPFLPPSKNKYDGWDRMWQNSCKKKWKNHVDRHVKALLIPEAEQIGLSAQLVFPERIRRDPQNYASTLWNFVPDALQESGVLTGDHMGKIQFPAGLGVSFAYDARKGIPRDKRMRTNLVITMKVAD